jgi:hypothetical protein
MVEHLPRKDLLVGGQPGQNSPRDPISKMTRLKWPGGELMVASDLQVWSPEASSPPSPQKVYSFLTGGAQLLGHRWSLDFHTRCRVSNQDFVDTPCHSILTSWFPRNQDPTCTLHFRPDVDWLTHIHHLLWTYSNIISLTFLPKFLFPSESCNSATGSPLGRGLAGCSGSTHLTLFLVIGQGWGIDGQNDRMTECAPKPHCKLLINKPCTVSIYKFETISKWKEFLSVVFCIVIQCILRCPNFDKHFSFLCIVVF